MLVYSEGNIKRYKRVQFQKKFIKQAQKYPVTSYCSRFPGLTQRHGSVLHGLVGTQIAWVLQQEIGGTGERDELYITSARVLYSYTFPFRYTVRAPLTGRGATQSLTNRMAIENKSPRPQTE